MKKIAPQDLAAFSPFCGLFPIEEDPIYADEKHSDNHFGQIYHTKAHIWGHRDMVKVVLLAAKRLNAAHGWTLLIKDCLRPVEAQRLIGEAPISKANPQWFQDPPFMSSPGKGAHPRGMAVDIAVKNVDMGTPVDWLTQEASRSYTRFPNNVLVNRRTLEDAMVKAGHDLGLHIHPLSNEWWDFRFLPEVYNSYEPLSDEDLLPHQRMVGMPDPSALEPDQDILKALSSF